MMFFLALDILAKCVFFSVNAYIYKNNSLKGISNFVFAILPVAPVTLLSVAAILNLNNWMFYYVKIGEMASHVDPKAMKLGEQKTLTFYRRMLNGVTIIAISLIFSYLIYVCYWSMH
jgi:hypothetical protein